jgi:trans-aconitate 2-methyltransferase
VPDGRPDGRPGDGPDENVYTFGTNSTAAARLALLAEVYEAGSRALLARWCPPDPGHAVDLGCGPGHTAVLLHRMSGARRTTGVERSPEYVADARATAPDGVTYVEADVTRNPLPVDPADVVHARFLLTHLAAPRAAVRLWTDLLEPGGRLILFEVARLVSREPALGRYYELVAELQEHHGQSLDVGRDLRLIAEDALSPGLVVEHAAVRPWHPPVAAMATLHVLNLRSWREDRFAARAFDPDELDALDAALVGIAHGGPSEPIEQDLAEVVVTREG